VSTHPSEPRSRNQEQTLQNSTEPSSGIPASQQLDPVCGMRVSADSAHRTHYAGREYVFCCKGCLSKFQLDPRRYAPAVLSPGPAPSTAPVAAEAPTAPAGTIYTCPMHPQIRRGEPGSCPICGMALEPLQPTAASGPSPELRDMMRRFWIGAALAFPLLLLEMGAHLSMVGPQRVVSPLVALWVQFALATPVVLWAGWPLLERGWASLRNRSLNMFSLISLGVGASYLYSLVATFAPHVFPASLRAEGGLVPVYYEAAAVITVLVLLGQVLELRARETTGSAIRALLNLSPKVARRISNDGTDEEIPLELVQVGDRLRVRPGEAVPVDGVVLDGTSAVDESMVTGESMPVAKNEGAKLIGATINGTGALVMRAERVGADTVLSRIVQMVAEAQRSRAPIQRVADVVSGWPSSSLHSARSPAGCLRVRRHNLPMRSSLPSRYSSLPALARSDSQRPCRSWWASVEARQRASSSRMPRPSSGSRGSIRSLWIRPVP
jgi:Cu+-exporting ATPase